MLRLLVADKNVNARKQIASILIEAGYDVMVTDKAVKAMVDVLNNNAQVLLLGTELEGLNSAELLPLLMQPPSRDYSCRLSLMKPPFL